MVISFALVSAALARPACYTQAIRTNPAFTGTVYDWYRPQAVGFIDSAIYPMRVHYRREDDAARVANVVLPALEQSWAETIDEMGWPAPPSDGYAGGSDALDIYLTNEGTGGGAYVWGGGPDVLYGDTWYTVPSYMAIDETLPDIEMLYYAAHELNHVSQYAIDGVESSTFVWESVADAVAVMVDETQPYIRWGGVPSFQEFPFLSLVFDSYRREVRDYDSWSYYEYGGLIFPMFLEQHYGLNDGATMLALWDGLAQPTPGDEVDFLDALASIEPNGSLAALYTEFAVWRMFAGELDDGQHFEDGALWTEEYQVGVEATFDLSNVDGFVGEPVHLPYDLGTNYYVVELGAGTDEVLQVDVTGDPGAHWGVAWAVWAADGTATTGTVVGAPGALVQAAIPLAGGVRAQFGVVNGGPPDMVARMIQPRRSVEIALALVPPPVTTTPGTTTPGTTTPGTTTPGTTTPGTTPTEPTEPTEPAEPTGDTGTAPDDDEPTEPARGCGCAASPSPAAPSALLIGALAWLRRRPRAKARSTHTASR
jgi:hypothetical protein